MCLVAIHSGERDVACQLVSHTNLVRAAWHLARRGQMLGCVYSFFAQPPPLSLGHIYVIEHRLVCLVAALGD